MDLSGLRLHFQLSEAEAISSYVQMLPCDRPRALMPKSTPPTPWLAQIGTEMMETLRASALPQSVVARPVTARPRQPNALTSAEMDVVCEAKKLFPDVTTVELIEVLRKNEFQLERTATLTALEDKQVQATVGPVRWVRSSHGRLQRMSGGPVAGPRPAPTRRSETAREGSAEVPIVAGNKVYDDTQPSRGADTTDAVVDALPMAEAKRQQLEARRTKQLEGRPTEATEGAGQTAGQQGGGQQGAAQQGAGQEQGGEEEEEEDGPVGLLRVEESLDFVEVGTALHVEWDVEEGAVTSHDWIGVYRPGDKLNRLAWDWCRGRQSLVLSATDAMHGVVEMRLYRAETWGYQSVGRTRPIHIGPRVDVVAEVGDEALRVSWSHRGGPALDASAWIGLFESGEPDNCRFLNWESTANGDKDTLFLPLPEMVGRYEIRMFPYSSMQLLWSNASFNTIAKSASFAVEPPEADYDIVSEADLL